MKKYQWSKLICSSVNQVICHGIPSDKKILKDGDILNIDVTVIRDGWHGDTSKMFLVGKTQPHNERLVKVTQECLYKAIDNILCHQGIPYLIVVTEFIFTIFKTNAWKKGIWIIF